MKLREINKKEFYDFCKNNLTDNFYQTKEYAELSRKKGWYTYFVGVDQNGKIRAATMLMARDIKFTKYRIFYSPRGFVANIKDLELIRFFTKELENYIKDKNGAFLRIDPYYPLRELDNKGIPIQGSFNNEKAIEVLKSLGYLKNENLLTRPNIFYKLELKGKNNDELLNNIDIKYQEIINENYNKGYRVRDVGLDAISNINKLIKEKNFTISYIDDISSINDLFNIFGNSNMIKIKAVEIDIDIYIENLMKCLENEKENPTSQNTYDAINRELNLAKQLQFKYGHKVIMGYNISVYYDKEVTTICTVINNNFTNYDPIYSLIWETIKDAKKSGYITYNLCQLNSDFMNDDKIFKYYKFFNADVIELIGEFDLVINEFIYKHYIKRLNKKKNKITVFKSKKATN